ncbi:hypothetical protein [Paucihalobacter sp.]|uniref:hypothetical protein n=1 Tax=Paucihalobacter sp. TaxID=2850405 RepID=UPI002FE2FFA5
MKTLKITFLLLAILVLTLSGTSADQTTNEAVNVKQNSIDLNLLVHAKEKAKLESNG